VALYAPWVLELEAVHKVLVILLRHLDTVSSDVWGSEHLRHLCLRLLPLENRLGIFDEIAPANLPPSYWV
jgi:hypothetical protein